MPVSIDWPGRRKPSRPSNRRSIWRAPRLRPVYDTFLGTGPLFGCRAGLCRACRRLFPRASDEVRAKPSIHAGVGSHPRPAGRVGRTRPALRFGQTALFCTSSSRDARRTFGHGAGMAPSCVDSPGSRPAEPCPRTRKPQFTPLARAPTLSHSAPTFSHATPRRAMAAPRTVKTSSRMAIRAPRVRSVRPPHITGHPRPPISRPRGAFRGPPLA